jgi:uncharacterized membrane protein
LEVVLELIEFVALGIEILAVALIVVGILAATVFYLRNMSGDLEQPEVYEQYKIRLGRALLLGLEVLVAADIVRTVALEPSLLNVAVLGLLVLIRTFLSWSLVVEIEHRWPWQQRQATTEPAPDQDDAADR